jgi:hypothetical protein
MKKTLNNYLMQGVLFVGEKEFGEIGQGFSQFSYDKYVYFLEDFKDYLEVNMDIVVVEPRCLVEEYEDEEDYRSYYKAFNLYGSGEEIILDGPETFAVLITNLETF